MCISAECCWSPGRGRGRQREPEREKAKWWELEQQQRLLPRCSSCPGIGSAASTPLRRRRCLRFKSPRRSVVLPGAKRSCFILFFFFLFSWKNICLTTPLLFLYCKRYFVSLMCLFFESRYGTGKKITQGRMSKEMCREVVGFSFPPFIAELRR